MSAFPQVSSIIGFYSNPDPLGLENDLRQSHNSHSPNTKRLKSQDYTKKTRNYSNIAPLLMILRYLQINLHQMKNIVVFTTKEYIFWLKTAAKVSTTLINQPHKKQKGNIHSEGTYISSERKHIPIEGAA